MVGRERKRLGNALGLDQFGVNLARLGPGAASSQRHWHTHEDEFLEVGSRTPVETVDYSDIDMRAEREGAATRYLCMSGAPYPVA